MSDQESWGIHAFGSSGNIHLSLDERCNADDWELEITIGIHTLRFRVTNSGEPKRICDFLSLNYGKTKSHIIDGTRRYSMVTSIDIGTPDRTQAHLAKCGELPDRFNFGIIGPDLRCHIDFHDPVTSDLLVAFEALVLQIDQS